MQIFILNPHPVQSATLLHALSPVRANKMVVEGMQAVATLCYEFTLPVPVTIHNKPYKPRRFPKPLMAWLKESKYNLLWFKRSLLTIQTLNHKPHASLSSHNLMCLNILFTKLPNIPRTPFCNYAKSTDKNLDFTALPVVEAYHKYLITQLLFN